MNIIPLSDTDSQIMNVVLDNYRVTLNVKFFEDLRGVSIPPVMDIYINGFPDVTGIPLVYGADLVYRQVKSGCLPFDFGSLFCIPDPNDVVDRSTLVSGSAALVYFNVLETISMRFTRSA